MSDIRKRAEEMAHEHHITEQGLSEKSIADSFEELLWRVEEFYRQAFPNCIDNDHCKSRREYGDGTCGCFHDSLGMLAKAEPLGPTPQRLWTKHQVDEATAQARRDALTEAANFADESNYYIADGIRALIDAPSKERA